MAGTTPRGRYDFEDIPRLNALLDHSLLLNLTFAGSGHTGFQAQGNVLDDLNTLGAPASDGQFIVATGAGAFAYESGVTARTSIGLGTGDSPTFTDLTLTGDLTADEILIKIGDTDGWRFKPNQIASSLSLQLQESGVQARFGLWPKDGDGTDNVSLDIYGVGTPADRTNEERLVIEYLQTGTLFEIFTQGNNGGTVRPLIIYTSGNSNQIYLGTDGDVGINTSTPDTKFHANGNIKGTGKAGSGSTYGGDALNVTGGKGGTSGVTGYRGGDIVLTGGLGGNAIIGAVNATGGDLLFTGGAGGASTTDDGGTGGTVTLTGGEGGRGGVGGEDIAGDGGDVELTSGAKASTGTVPGVDGNIRLNSLGGLIYIGDGGTANHVIVSGLGDVLFVGNAGLVFGSFWGNDIAFVSAGGTGTYFEIFDGDITTGQLHNVTHNTSGENTLDIGPSEGMYLVNWSMSIKATGADKHLVGGIGVDAGGASGSLTIQNDGRSHAVSTGNAEFSISGTAILDLSASSEVGLMATNETDNTNVTIEHVSLSIVQIGGT